MVNNIRKNIGDYCNTFGIQAQDTSKKSIAIEHDSEHKIVSVALSSLQNLTRKLSSVEQNPILFLCESSRHIKNLESYCRQNPKSPLENTALSCNIKGTDLLLHIDVALIDHFLQLNHTEQTELMANKEHAAIIRQALHNPSLNNSVRDRDKGDFLFHQLCRSESKEIRQLAIECLSSGFDINQETRSGATGLHLAVQKGDNGLIKSLLEHGANVTHCTLPIGNRAGLTAIDLALMSKQHSSALMMALHQPNLHQWKW